MFGTIEEAAAALDAGSTTSADIVEESLAAITRHGQATNAFVTVRADRARAEAAAADRERAGGTRRGPLHGIPISLKDLIDEAGVVTTAGSRVLNDRTAGVDATLVRRLRDAGAIVIGRTNLHEFALGTTSEDSAFGPVRHPRDPDRSAGGSSGGSGAAVATGMGLASVGTDTGGSIRIPAAACGVVGVKPSAGEVPMDGVIPLSTTLDTAGPLARSTQDAAWLLDVIAGRPPSLVRRRQAGMLRLKRLVGYFDALEPALRASFDQALAQLAGGGIRITEGELTGAEGIAEAYTRIVLAEGAWWHTPYLDARADDYTPAVRARLAAGRDVPAVQYLAALATARQLRAAVDEALDGTDALILPTLPIVAPLLGLDAITIDPEADGPLPVRAAMLKHTQPFNLSGHPAVSLPVPATPLPVGLQIVGRIGRTSDLLEVAATCERLLGARE